MAETVKAGTAGIVDRPAPSVSVIVPVKNSEGTVRELVESLLQQHYEGRVEIILVGDVGDTSWTAIEDYIDQGRVVLIEAGIQSVQRDSNAKRKIGLERASGEVLALTDSDMILPPTWVATAVGMLETGRDCVAGPMWSEDKGFWGKYMDDNALGNKTPRMQKPYTLVVKNFGVWHKPPLGANFFMCRKVYERVGGPDSQFVWSFEDYSYFWTIVDAGFAIHCVPELAGRHHHRNTFAALRKDYRRAGRGCADYVTQFPRSPFSRKRILQISLVLLLLAGVAPFLYFVPYGPFCGASLVVLIGTVSALLCREAKGFVYPWITLMLGLSYLRGFFSGLWHNRGEGHRSRVSVQSVALSRLAVAEAVESHAHSCDKTV